MAEGKISVIFLFGKVLKQIFYSDTLYVSLQKIAEKERKSKLPDMEVYPICDSKPVQGHFEVWIAIKKEER